MSYSETGGVKLHGLLYIPDRGAESYINVKSRDPVSIFILCAILLAKSAARAGVAFAIITNDAAKVQARFESYGIDWIPVRPFKFSLEIPKNIPFYSAHYKLEILSAFGRGEFGSHVGLIDIDAVIMGRLAPTLLQLDPELCVYDISAQEIPAYGYEIVSRDIHLLCGEAVENPRWYGGEFIVGKCEVFSRLAEHIEWILPKYLENLNNIHHIGAETVLSAAVNLLDQRGVQILDAGRPKIVTRWWSSRTLAEQEPFDDVADSLVLHFPGDKEFLAAEASREFDPQTFLDKYRRHIRRKIFVCRLVNRWHDICGRRTQFIATVSRKG